MKLTNFRERLKSLCTKIGKGRKYQLAAAVVTGGLLFSGGVANAANLIENGGFEIADGDPGSAWTNQGANYTHPYGGISGPQLTDVGTLNDYGFNNNISADAGSNFHGLSFPTTQTVDLVNADLTAADILAGEGRFAFSSWLATCCNDVPQVIATFNDVASTSVALNRGIATNMQTTADVLVNPGGANNAESMGVATDANRRYWALYEYRGVIPTDATQVTITVTDGRAEAAAAGATVAGNGNDNYADMIIFDAVQSTVVVNDPLLRMTIDRATGQITLANNTGAPQQIKGYSLISDAGALIESNATFLADSDSNWVQLTASGATSDISEGHLTTDTFSNGESFNLGNAWLQYPEDETDLTFEYIDGSGDVVAGILAFTGAPFVEGDLDFDGDVDGQDWLTYVGGLGSTFPGMSIAQTYRLGDFDGDGDNDHADFLAFKSAYEAVNGPGSFADMVASVPEPSTLVLFVIAGVVGLVWNRRKIEIVGS